MPDTTLYIRVKQALTWLKRNQGILQKDVADKMGMAEASFTRALARIKEKNDEDFVISFHSAVSKFISLDYLLYGRGDMLVQKEKSNSMPTDTPSAMPSSLDRSFLIEKEIGNTKSYMDKYIERLEKDIKHIENDNSLKDEIIASLQKQVADLRKDKASLQATIEMLQQREGLEKFIFPPGVAEKKDNDTTHV